MSYALFLSYRGAVIGNGFVADISATGRLLATVEPEGWWLYGVNPGAIAADGRSLDDAHAAFREALRLVFVDFAVESNSFEDFKTKVVAYFDAADQVDEWEAAVAAHRTNQGEPIDLPKRPAETRAFITVDCRDTEELTAEMNVPAMNFPVSESTNEPPLARAA